MIAVATVARSLFAGKDSKTINACRSRLLRARDAGKIASNADGMIDLEEARAFEIAAGRLEAQVENQRARQKEREPEPREPKQSRPVKNEELTQEEVEARKRLALMKQAEEKAIQERMNTAKMRGDLIPKVLVSEQVYRHLERAVDNILRIGDSYLTDVGHRIVKEGKVTPEIRAKFTSLILSASDDAKKEINKTLSTNK